MSVRLYDRIFVSRIAPPGWVAADDKATTNKYLRLANEGITAVDKSLVVAGSFGPMDKKVEIHLSELKWPVPPRPSTFIEVNHGKQTQGCKAYGVLFNVVPASVMVDFMDHMDQHRDCHGHSKTEEYVAGLISNVINLPGQLKFSVEKDNLQWFVLCRTFLEFDKGIVGGPMSFTTYFVDSKGKMQLSASSTVCLDNLDEEEKAKARDAIRPIAYSGIMLASLLNSDMATFQPFTCPPKLAKKRVRNGKRPLCDNYIMALKDYSSDKTHKDFEYSAPASNHPLYSHPVSLPVFN